MCPRSVRKDLPPHPFFKKQAQAPRPAETYWISLAHGQDLAFPLCVRGLCENNSPQKISEKTNTSAEACLGMFIFSSPSQGPHLPVLNPKFGRTFFPLHPFLKKRMHAPKVVLKNQHFVARSRDLTVPCCVPDLAEHICPNTHFTKN